MTEAELQAMRDMKEPTDPDAVIPWCGEGKTVAQSKKDCPLGGCWKYRCYSSKLNASWHVAKEKHLDEKFGRKQP
jgi:hypothetical protein